MHQVETPHGIKFAWRVSLDRYESEKAFQRLLDFTRKNLDVIDEIALFDTFTHHLYIPLDVYRERAKRMGACLQMLKETGVRSTGINVLTTIGHLNEAWDFMPALPFQPLVGHDGKIARSCACPNSEELRQYVREKYSLVAEQSPDFIWVDDDIRMHHQGVDYPCFCPVCLNLFSRISGRAWTREELVSALNDPAQPAIRLAWVNHIMHSLDSLMSVVEDAIHAVNPRIETGLMTAGPGWNSYSGNAYGRWMRTLKATKGRPGGGFYSDFQRLGVLEKTVEVGRQRFLYPAEVRDCQYELENFPYQALQKSVRSMMNECALALGMGLNGIAFNALGMWDGSMDEFVPVASGARKNRSTWERWAAHTENLPGRGLWTAWNTWVMAKREVRPGEDWFGGDSRYDILQTSILSQICLPICAEPPGDVTVLFGGITETIEEDTLRDFFKGGVLVDSEALDVLTRRGLGHLAGVRIQKRLDNGVVECFTDDPLNGPFAGEIRDARVEFWGKALGKADLLEPVRPGVQILATMQDYFKRPLGACMTAYENELGGRVVVMGYAPWMFLHSLPKVTQMHSLADWLSRDRLPVRVSAKDMVVPFIRLSDDRTRGGLILFNAGMEAVENTVVELRANVSEVQLLGKSNLSLPVEPTQNGIRFTIPLLEAWSTTFLLF